MTSPRGPRWRAWLLGLAGGLVGLLLVGLFALRQPPIATRLASAILARLPAPRGAVMSAREVRGDWITGLEVRGFRMTRGDTLLITADTLRIRYRLASLSERRIDVQEIELAGAVVTADIAGAGPDSADSPPEDPRKPPFVSQLLRGGFYRWHPIHVERLVVRDGRYDARAGASDSTLRVTRIALRAHDVRLGDGFSFVIDSLEVRGSPAWNGGPTADVALAATLDDGRFELRALALRGGASEIEARGVLALDDRDSLSEGSLTLRALPLALGELHSLAPGLGLDGVVATELDLHGTRLDRLSGTVALTFDRAHVGSLEFGASQLNAKLDDGRADVELSVLYNESRADVSGWIKPLDHPPTYDLEARIDSLAIRIPGGSARDIERAEAAVALRVRGSGYAKGAFDVEGRVDSDAGHLEVEGRVDLARGFDWAVRRLAFENVDVARLSGDTTASAFSGTLTATGRGAQPESLRALAELEIGPSTYGEWRIESARARASLDGAAFGGALDLDTNAGGLEVDSIAGRWDSAGTLRLLGARFHDVDLERLTGNASVASRLGGTLSGEGRGFAALGSNGGAGAALRDGRVSAEVALDLAPSQFRGQEIERGSLRLSLAGGVVSVTGDIASSTGRVDLDAGARPFASPPSYVLHEARFADLDLAPWSGVAALRSKLSGTLTGGSRVEESGEGLAWDAALHLDSSRVGSVELDGGEARASWSGGRGQLAAQLFTAGDSVSAQGEIDVRDGVPEGTADVSIPFGAIAALVGRDSLASEGRLVAVTSFVGLSPATATMRGEITARGTIDSVRVDSLRIGVRLEHGTLALDTLAALSNVGLATGSGRVALFDSSSAAAISDLRVSLALTDVSPLRRLLGADTLAVRDGSLALQLEGPAGERALEARGALGSLAWNDTRLLAAQCVVRGTFDRGWGVMTATAEASVQRLVGRGVDVSEAGAHVAYAGRETEFDVSAILDDQLRLRVGGRALSDSLGTHVTLETADAATDSIAFALARPTRIDVSPGRLAVDDLEIRSDDSRIAAHGVIDRQGDQDFRLEIEDLGAGFLSAALGREGLGGTVNGDLTLEGPATAPRGNGSVHLDLVSDGRPAGVLRSNLSWDGTYLDLEGSFTTSARDSIAWRGHLPMAVSLAKSDSGAASPMRFREGDVDVRLTANRFPLGALSPLLDPRVVGEMEGTLDLDARLQGSRRELVGNGTVALTGGVVPLPGLGVTYREIEFSGDLEANDLVIRRARLQSEKGSLDISGQIQFVSATRTEPRLHVIAKRFTFADSPQLRATGSAELDVTGTMTEPIVKGTARIENSSYNLTQSGAAAAGVDTTLQLSDADVQMMEETFGFVKAQGPGLTRRLYDESDLDVDITLERDNWLRQRAHPRLAVALTGNVHLLKAPFGEPVLTGRVELVPGRGYVEQFARSFDIVSGEVLLNGDMKKHTIDVEAQYKPPSGSGSDESEVIVRLDVEGSFANMALTLSSEPSMSQGEIISYIATGRSRAPGASPTGSSDSDANIAKDIGMSQVTSGAEQAAQEAIGLDVLQIRFDALQGATLVAGRYLNSQLYVGFRQPLQYKDTASPSSQDEFSTSFDVEYAIHQWLIFNLQGETSTLRSFIRARHAY